MPPTPPDEVPDADAALVHGHQPPSARVPLSRERIVATAVAYIDTHGLADLTMRRLGTELGVEAMSLYRYVTGREELLDAVVEHLVADLAQDTEVVREPTHGWQDFTQRLAHGIRRIALAHPNAFPLVASRPGQAPWLRPPLRSLEWVELFLAGLVAEGFTREQAVAAYGRSPASCWGTCCWSPPRPALTSVPWTWLVTPVQAVPRSPMQARTSSLHSIRCWPSCAWR